MEACQGPGDVPESLIVQGVLAAQHRGLPPLLDPHIPVSDHPGWSSRLPPQAAESKGAAYTGFKQMSLELWL